jgi:hypothetical protein
VVAIIALVGIRLCTGPEETLAFLLYDDAYYYFGVARNLAGGHGSTFDGINPTNGYHPLWCWLLVPVFALVDDPGRAVRIIAGAWFVLAAVAPCALWWALRPRTGASGAVMAAALFGLQPVLAAGLSRPNGLETPLYALLVAVAIGRFERVCGTGPSPPTLVAMAGLGATLGAVTLARMDGGFLGVAAAVLLVAHGFRAWGPRAAAGRIGILVGAAAVVVAPSLMWNVARFDHPVPVSGRVVALVAADERAELGGALSTANLRRRAGYGLGSVPAQLARGAIQGTAMEKLWIRTGPLGGMAALAAAGTLVTLALARRRRSGPLLTDAVALLASFCALHYTLYVGWLWASAETWYRLYYFMPEVMLLAAACGAALGPALDAMGSPVVRRSVGAAGLALVAWHLSDHAAKLRTAYEAKPGPVAQRHIYGWIRERMSPGEVLGARDAGKLGFFSDRPVVNLDGLINDQRLLEALRQDRVAEYVCASPIRYLLYDRPLLGGFDPASPTTPPVDGSVVGSTLYRLHALPGCSIGEIPGATDDWVVVEVTRR